MAAAGFGRQLRELVGATALAQPPGDCHSNAAPGSGAVVLAARQLRITGGT